jgi:hypothetical protein
MAFPGYLRNTVTRKVHWGDPLCATAQQIKPEHRELLAILPEGADCCKHCNPR